MKKYFKIVCFMFCLVMGFSSQAKGKITTLSGTIKGYNAEEAFFFKNTTIENDPGISLKIAKDGKYKISFELEQSTFDAAVNIGDFGCVLFMEPGGNYVVNADITDENSSATYVVAGSHTKENILVKNYGFKLQRFYNYWRELIANKTFKDYNNYIENIETALNTELQDTKNTDFISTMKKRIDYDAAFLRFLFGFISLEREMQSAGSLEKFKSDVDYDAYIVSPKWTSVPEETFSKFGGMLVTMVGFTYPDVNLVDILKNIKKVVPHQGAINSLSTSIIRDFYSNGGNGNPDELYNYYKSICTDTDALKEIDTEKALAKLLAPGNDAPEFEMTDSEGKIFKLSDFKGKAIFIDVWATWCGPCKEEIPFFQKLVNDYKDDNRIEFISISVDSNKNTWKKAVTQQAHNWKQFVVEHAMDSELCKKYQISAIPRFMFFNKEGKIISVKSPYPSDESFIKEFIDSALLN